MGMFVLPPLKKEEDITAEEFVDTAIKNIELWRKNPDYEYLLDGFACGLLERAARRVVFDRDMKELSELREATNLVGYNLERLNELNNRYPAVDKK